MFMSVSFRDKHELAEKNNSCQATSTFLITVEPQNQILLKFFKKKYCYQLAEITTAEQAHS